MEEVDKILILTLNHLGCDIDEKVKSVGGFGIEEVVSGVVRCIRTINSDCELPTSLPQNMAQRFRVAASIAQAVKDVGYPGDVGYQSLLYPNETDLRKIFMFLIEKLPKDTAAVSDEPLNKAALIHQEARRKLCASLTQSWIPAHCRHVARSYATRASVTNHGTYHTRQFMSKPYSSVESPSKVSPGLRTYYENYSRRITKMVGYEYLIATLLNSHAIQLQRDQILPKNTEEEGKSEAHTLEPLVTEDVQLNPLDVPLSGWSPLSSFETAQHMIDIKESEREVNLGTDVSAPEAGVTTEEQIRLKREEQLSRLQTEIGNVTNKTEECTQGIQDAVDALAKLTDDLIKEERLKEETVTELKMKQRTSSLLPESAANIQRLQGALKNSEEKMVRLQQQWQAHKKPLEEQLSQLTLEASNKKVNKEEILAEMSELRDKMKAMVQDASRKETALAQLKGQVEKMNKDINRSVYTKRIIDISAKEAANNERVRQVYRAVAAVHEGCGELVDIVRDTGTVQREIADLREQVDLEKSKKVEENLTQLKTDLNQVKKENASLKQQLL
ncbi:Coiled-coil domain-containing protein 22-like 1 [Homarus americanus]|uniref:Coiled-coil domain-containing protein 22 homolog n=2 Tax=Homarus americanus TaxID=6706 RepID=A0A8J5JSF1_HOMAM|nr:Coiled-coil domain-containing protein 22-like 1 [Homarus americanus]